MATESLPTDREPPLGMRQDVPLAPLTTLELGGSAQHLLEASDAESAIDGVRWARRHRQPLAVLGGGSNVVVSDRGWSGLILRATMRGIELERGAHQVRMVVAAGEPWDELVELTVAEDVAGLECLSGIPGWVGATPIQNVGAYGQEVADTIASVRVLDLETLVVRDIEAKDCGFSYRSSVFRRDPGRFLVLAVTFRLQPGGRPLVRYRELAESLQVKDATPSLRDVRRTVLDLRRSKSMVLDPADPNRRSAGSFFLNPVLDVDSVENLQDRARAHGVLAEGESVPWFDDGEGRIKVSAAWLVERAGFARGTRRGCVGLSSRHALALVHHGGGTAEDLVALASEIRTEVHKQFGVVLEPEPIFVGFSVANPL
jgi:UDP-N-acetylmuramate dehydrogenase